MKAFLWAALGGIGLAIPLLCEPEGHALRVLTLVLLFAAMGQAWNIVGGLAGQISLGHAAYFGIGAYTSTILLRDFGLSPWIGLLLAGVAAGASAVVISIPTMRLRGHYFALATLAFAEVLKVVANTWTNLTGGPGGISVPFAGHSPTMFQFSSQLPYYYIMLAALVAVSAVFAVMKFGPIGYRLRAIREDEGAAEVIGVDTYRVKLQAAILSATITGCLGTLFAQFSYFFDPESIFSPLGISVRMALITIIGGIGTVAGPIVGALLLLPSEQILNELLGNRAAGLSQLLYGVLLIAIVLMRPQGLSTLSVPTWITFLPKFMLGTSSRR
jgi:branched-chain amino acid transport system permease protein